MNLAVDEPVAPEVTETGDTASDKGKEEEEKKEKKIGCNTEEVVAVLGHELGHWYHSHMVKNLVIMQVRTLYIAYLHTCRHQYIFAKYIIFTLVRSNESIKFQKEMRKYRYSFLTSAMRSIKQKIESLFNYVMSLVRQKFIHNK